MSGDNLAVLAPELRCGDGLSPVAEESHCRVVITAVTGLSRGVKARFHSDFGVETLWAGEQGSI